MRNFLALLFVGLLFASAPAWAAGPITTVFPPDNEKDCMDTGQKFLSWYSGAGATHCSSGQEVLNNALITNTTATPDQRCSAGKVVVYDGSKFVCKAEATVPSCTPNEFLSFDGTTYQCKSTGVATCSNNQVLTFNGTSYFCVNKDASIPVCAANQFLTYNGSYQCAAVQTPAPLNIGCPAGQALTGISNNQPLCTPIAAETTPTPPADTGTCEFLTVTLQGLGSGNFFAHRFKDGHVPEFTNAPLLFSNPYYPMSYTVTNVPTGWQDTQGGFGGGGFTPSTCGYGESDSKVCYTCVNGNWSPYGYSSF